jgi:hypothetical protein
VIAFGDDDGMTDEERARAVNWLVWDLYWRERLRIWKHAIGCTVLVVVGLVIVLFWD